MTGVLKNCPAYCSQVFFTFWRYITVFVALILFLGVNCNIFSRLIFCVRSLEWLLPSEFEENTEKMVRENY